MLSLERDVLPWLRRDTTPADTVPTPPDKALLHAFYDRSVKHKTDIAAVFGDAYPKYLDLNRPNEQEKHKKYRKDVYRNPFRGFPNRVKNALDYIKQADDFELKWPILGDNVIDRLEEYAGDMFSASGDVINWFFEYAVKAYLRDPNAVLLTLPEEAPYSDQAYPEPKLHLIPSEYVWMHRKGKFAVLCSPRRGRVLMPDGKVKNDGLIVYFCDHDSYTIARQVAKVDTTGKGAGLSYQWQIAGLRQLGYDSENPDRGVFDVTGYALDTLPSTVTVVTEFSPPRHYCGTLPAMKVGRNRIDQNADDEELFESLLADTVPHIKDGQQAKSDMQVEFNFHISSKEWQRAPKKCSNSPCNGTGKVLRKKEHPNEKPQYDTCPVCKGTGWETTSGSGMEIIYVSDIDAVSMVPGATGGKVPAGAPGGFIPRSIEPLKELREELKRCTHEAFGTIHMQFVMETPLEVSGASKAKDREEMYRSLNNEGAHLVGWLLQRQYKFLDAQRYGAAGRAGIQVPVVLVPVRYNLENIEMVRQELNDALNNKMDPTVIESLTLKFLEYACGKNSEQYRRYELRLRLDGFRELSPELHYYQLGVQYMLMQPGEEQNRAIERMWLSINFDGLVSDAVIEHPDFWNYDLEKQKDILLAANKKLIGDLQPKGVQPGMFPQVDALKINPLVDLQQMQQTPDSFANPV